MNAKEESRDGRKVRRRRNRDNVIDAFIDVVRSGEPNPSTRDVAERAGVSQRSVYRYFPDRDDLVAAVCERLIATFKEPCRVAPDASLSDRIDAFVEHRLDLFEQTSPLTRSARSQFSNSPAVITASVEISLAIRAQIDTVFAPEFEKWEGSDPVASRVALYMPFVFDSLDMAFSVMDRAGVTQLLREHLDRFFSAASVASASNEPEMTDAGRAVSASQPSRPATNDGDRSDRPQ